MSGQAQSPQDTPYKVSHIEVRRVQNGFVIMAHNFSYQPGEYTMRNGAAASFVATSIEELQTVIGSLARCDDIDWIPTADIPLVDMVRRPIEAQAVSNDPA